ncbi:MAG: molecular chaperone Skp [Ignavibacteriales bacterium CG_4_9_14_3_um_filter_30_11]|nr:MAG: molecular chaperone Skp [Ignavibacteriales bacterium CG_4_9_14_3_um_filter_30_11]
MKKVILFIFGLLIITSSNSLAQLKIGYVDSETIMQKLPDAQDAQQKLDDLVNSWRTELIKMQSDLKNKQADFEKKKLIMSEKTKAENVDELGKLERLIDLYRDKKFGSRGELFQKQNELMKPIQNKLFTAIKEIAEEENLDFVFDRTSDITLLYAKEKYDITNLVLQKLKLE